MLELAARPQVLVFVTSGGHHGLVLLLRSVIGWFFGTFAGDSSQLGHRTQEIIEDMHDGGDIATRPTFGVLQSRIQGSAERAGVDAFSATLKKPILMSINCKYIRDFCSMTM